MPSLPFDAAESEPDYVALFPTPSFDPYDLDLDAVLPEKGPTKGLVYQFRITLTGIEPPVWRRIQVAAGYSFWDMHVAIVDAMGWRDSHIHLFSVRNPKTGVLDPIGIYDPEEPDCLPDFLIPIACYFRLPGERAWYTYDYGDFWVHDVVLEAVLLREKGRRYPVCMDGARACPPEDVGGPSGYRVLLLAQDDPGHPEHEAYREWLGSRYDAEVFDPRKVKFDSPRRRWERAFLLDVE